MNKHRERYDIEGMIIVTVLMIIGIVIIYFSWGAKPFTIENIYSYFYTNGMIFIFSIFFIGVGIYCWKLYIENVLIKPKETTLYLSNKNEDTYIFIDQKGTQYPFETDERHFLELEYYYRVLKTKREIVKLIGPSTTSFSLKSPKESYWLNWYSPIGDFKNIFLLPIVYLIAIPGIGSFIMAEGPSKLIGLIISLPPIFLIGYDLMYKIKKQDKVNEIIKESYSKESKNYKLNNIDNTEEFTTLKKNSEKIMYILPLLISAMSLLIVIIIFTGVLIKINGLAGKFFFTCVLLIITTQLFKFIYDIYIYLKPKEVNSTPEKIAKQDKIKRILTKLPILVFLFLWFVFIGFMAYILIKDNSFKELLFLIPFIIFGIVALIKS